MPSLFKGTSTSLSPYELRIRKTVKRGVVDACFVRRQTFFSLNGDELAACFASPPDAQTRTHAGTHAGTHTGAHKGTHKGIHKGTHNAHMHAYTHAHTLARAQADARRRASTNANARGRVRARKYS
eukprot:3039572-Pleurochrysis_carterae.AAC.1